MATAAVLNLPDVLREHADEIDRALAVAVHHTWPEDETYCEAPSPAAIGAVLVDAIHTEISEYSIGYLFREKFSKRGKVTLAQASKVGGKLQHYSELDFLIEVNWERWRMATPAHRLALIDHELCHFGIDFTDQGEKKAVLVPHDVEEFSAIVQRWGVWKRDLHQFALALATAPQFDLFGQD
jgi:hypothetical protein